MDRLYNAFTFYDIIHVHFSLRTTASRKRPFVELAKLFRKKVIVHLHCGTQIDEIWNNNYYYLFDVADVSLFLSDCLRKKVMTYFSVKKILESAIIHPLK